ncbi:DUF4388 domain-containing protein [bacterium]|nr:DUF4388 domain-containing protein [bacterium]
MSLQGSTRDFALPDIFQLIGFQEKSGILELSHSVHGILKIFFSKGSIVGVEYNGVKLEEFVKKFLTKTNKLTEEKIKKFEELSSRSIQNFSNHLLELGIVESDELKKISRREINNLIFSAFSWGKTNFQFITMDSLYFDQLMLIPIKCEDILLGIAEEMDMRSDLEKKLPPFNTIIEKTTKKKEGHKLSESLIFLEDPEIAIYSLSEGKKSSESLKFLQDPEIVIYNLIDGRKSIKEIEEIAPYSQFIIHKSICNLIDKGLCKGIEVRIREKAVEQKAEFKIKTYVIRVIPYILIFVLITLFWYIFHNFGANITQLTDKQKTRANSLKWIFCIMKLDQISKAIEAYNLINNSYPKSLLDVVEKKYISKEDIYDPWGNEIEFHNSQKGVVIKSSGIDKKFGTEDDITVGPPEYKE